MGEGKGALKSERHEVNMTIKDPLLCIFCGQPLNIPAFQCEKYEHLACSSCCNTESGDDVRNCHCGSIFKRCHAIEKVINAIQVPCDNTKHGCEETSIVYSKKRDHLRTCKFTPFPCPHENCGFIGLLKQLSAHLKSSAAIHSHSAESFPYNLQLYIKFSDTYAGAEFKALVEQTEGEIFLLIYKRDSTSSGGFRVAVFVIQPAAAERKFLYELRVAEYSTSFKMQSFVETIDAANYTSPSSIDFSVLPHLFIPNDRSSSLRLHVRIWPARG